MAGTQLGIFDAALAEKHRRAQEEADIIALAQKSFSPKVFKKWKAEYDEENTFFARPRKPLRPDLKAHMDKIRAEILANAKPFLANEYPLLGIERGADKREIKNAYRRMARKLHPDKGGDEAAMKALNAAYKRLLAAVKE